MELELNYHSSSIITLKKCRLFKLVNKLKKQRQQWPCNNDVGFLNRNSDNVISIKGKCNEPSPLQLWYFQNKMHTTTRTEQIPLLLFLSGFFFRMKSAKKQKFCHASPPESLQRVGGYNVQSADESHLVVGVWGLRSLAADAFEFGRYPRYQAAPPQQRVGLAVRVISSHFVCSWDDKYCIKSLSWKE